MSQDTFNFGTDVPSVEADATPTTVCAVEEELTSRSAFLERAEMAVLAGPEFRSGCCKYCDGLIEQIIRDGQTILENLNDCVPVGQDFYRQRIESYREALRTAHQGGTS